MKRFILFMTKMTKVAVCIMALLLNGLPLPQAHALPQGEEVVSGSASFERYDNTLNVTTSDRVIINYDSFSIACPETVNFFQPSSSSVALNRVVGTEPSSIFGALNANGLIFIINPNGILFSPTSQVNVGGLVASTLNIANQDFLSGQYRFYHEAGRSLSSVINEGSLIASLGGSVSLLGGAVENKGLIVANLGSVNLASGEVVTLNLDDEGLILATVSEKVKEDIYDANNIKIDSGVENSGTISAKGGQVLITAEAVQDVFDTLINQEGIIEANSIVEHDGKILLVSKSEGIVQNKGTLNASAIEAGVKGGTVEITGSKVGQFGEIHADAIDGDGGNISLYASDAVALTSDSLTTANAGLDGDGGTIIVYSPETANFWAGARIEAKGGSVSGDGGFVEVSGKNSMIFQGTVDLTAANGARGMLLIDPKNITITDTGVSVVADNDTFAENPTATADFSDESIEAALNGANLTLQANNDITVSYAVDSSGNTNNGNLTFQAGRSIDIDANITLKGSFTATANDTGAQAGNRDDGAATIDIADGITVNTSATNSNIVLTMSTGPGGTASGDIVIENLNAGTGHIDISQDGATANCDILQQTTDAMLTASSIALDVSASSGGSIGISGTPIEVTTTNLEARAQGGGVYISSPTQGLTLGGANLGGLSGVSTASGNGPISITATTGNITVGAGSTTDDVKTSGTGSVTITASAGSILDDNISGSKIDSNTVVLNATGSIGVSGNDIDTTIGATNSLTASSTSTGDIYIDVSGAVGSVTLTTANGGINLTSADSMTITAITAVGDGKNVTLTTTNSTADIKVNGNITALGDTVTLNAGRNITDTVAGTTSIISAATLTITTGNNASATTGAVGASGTINYLDTDVDTINVTTGKAGGVYILEDDAVTLNNITTTNGPITITTGGATIITDVTSTTDADANDISITASTGNITVATVNAGATLGDVTLVATAGSILDDAAATVITGDVVTLTAANAVGAAGNAIDTTALSLDVSVTAAGAIVLAETDGVTLSDVDTVNGSITISAGGALTATDVDAAGSGKDVNLSTTTGGMVLTSVTADDDITCTADAGNITIGVVGDAGTDNISITATTGSINAAADNAAVEVTAPTITLNAASGIGNSNNGLDISGTTITANVSGADADIDIDNTATAAVTATLTTTGDDGAAGSDILFEQTGGFALSITATTIDGDITVSNKGANLTATAVNAGNATADIADGNVTLTITTSGNIIATDIDAAGTTVNLTSVGDISVGDINAPAATVTLSAGGAITDTDNNLTDITAINLNLTVQTPTAETYYMRVTYVLWGQGNYGDCIFIKLPGADGILDTSDDKNVLIDGGYSSTTSGSKLDEFLTEKGVSVINYMVMSHPGADHYYGLYMVVRDTPDGMGLLVDYFYEVRDYAGKTTTYDNLKTCLSDGGTEVYNPTPGDYLSGPNTHDGWQSWDPNLIVRCLAADTNSKGSNNCSMILVAKMGSSCFLFGGDAQSGTDTEGVASAEQYAVDNYAAELADVHIYKVHHHGSNDASGSALLNAMTNLQYAIQQDGGSYLYHPSKEALDRITDAGAVIYRNDLDGDILIKCDNAGNYDITREVCYPTLPWTGFNNADTNGIYAPPALPTNLSVTSTTASNITLDWDDVSGATYDVFRSTTNNGDDGAGRNANPGCDASTGIYEKIAGDITVSNYTDNTVTAGTTYYYRVSSKKVETDGEGYQFRYERRYSDQASGTTSGAKGGIGASGANNELDTDVDTITASATGNIYILEKDAVTLSNVTSSSGLIDIEAGGDITINTVTANTSATLVSTGGSIYDASLLSASATSYLKALGGVIGTKNNPIDVNINGGDLWVYASGSWDAISANIAGTVSPSDTLRIGTPPVPPGLILFNNRILGGGNIIALRSRAIGELYLSGVDTTSLYYDRNLRPWEYRILLPWELEMGSNIIDDRFLLGPSALIDTSAIE